MTETKPGWLDRLLMKIAVAKTAARGGEPRAAAERLLAAFRSIDAASARTSQSADRAAQQ